MVTVTAESEYAEITLDGTMKAKKVSAIEKTLLGIGITKVTIDIKSADGKTETRYLEIVQLSDEIGIQTVEVDGIELMPDEAGNYETTVSNKTDLSLIKVVLKSSTSNISINGNPPEFGETQIYKSKKDARRLELPLKVTAEDGTSHTYTLTLNIISNDNNVQEVNVDGNKAELKDESYIAYIGKTEAEADIEIIAASKYANVTYGVLSDKEKINFKFDTSDISIEEFEIPFKITAEDGEEKEYNLILKRKSDDASIKFVYVDGIEIEPNIGHPKYADGTYYTTVSNDKARIRIITNNEYAEITFDEKTGLHDVEKEVTLSEDKITEIPVLIRSQEGDIYQTTIYIERISNNKNVLSVKVNDEDVDKGQEPNSYLKYIYETVNSVKVEINAESNEATIVITDNEGNAITNSLGEEIKAKEKIILNQDTLDTITYVYFKIVSENGEFSPIYTLQIEKMSEDATLKEVYVEGVKIEPNEKGEYIANVLDTLTNPRIRAVTTNEMASVRIALGEEKIHDVQERVTLSNGRQSVVPITVRSQSGITKVTYLYINRISTNANLDRVTLDGKEADLYDANSKTYTFIVDRIKTDFELFVLAESDLCLLEFNKTQYEASFTDLVHLDEIEER